MRSRGFLTSFLRRPSYYAAARFCTVGDRNVGKHDPIDNPGSSSDRRAAHMALQRRMGLLSERWVRSRTDRAIGADGLGAIIKRGAPSASVYETPRRSDKDGCGRVVFTQFLDGSIRASASRPHGGAAHRLQPGVGLRRTRNLCGLSALAEFIQLPFSTS